MYDRGAISSFYVLLFSFLNTSCHRGCPALTVSSWHPCQRSCGCIFMDLYLGYLFCSIVLYIFGTSIIFCSILWNQEVWWFLALFFFLKNHLGYCNTVGLLWVNILTMVFFYFCKKNTMAFWWGLHSVFKLHYIFWTSYQF